MTQELNADSEFEWENLVEITDNKEIEKYYEGTLVCVEHPTKGIRKVENDRIFINTVDLPEEWKHKFNS